MKIISKFFKIIIFIFLIISSGCGLLSTSLIINEQIQSKNVDNNGYIFGYDSLLEEEQKCMKPETLDIGACREGAKEFHLFFWRMIITFAIGGNMCLLTFVSLWYFRRRRMKSPKVIH